MKKKHKVAVGVLMVIIMMTINVAAKSNHKNFFVWDYGAKDTTGLMFPLGIGVKIDLGKKKEIIPYIETDGYMGPWSHDSRFSRIWINNSIYGPYTPTPDLFIFDYRKTGYYFSSFPRMRFKLAIFEFEPMKKLMGYNIFEYRIKSELILRFILDSLENKREFFEVGISKRSFNDIVAREPLSDSPPTNSNSNGYKELEEELRKKSHYHQRIDKKIMWDIQTPSSMAGLFLSCQIGVKPPIPMVETLFFKVEKDIKPDIIILGKSITKIRSKSVAVGFEASPFKKNGWTYYLSGKKIWPYNKISGQLPYIREWLNNSINQEKGRIEISAQKEFKKLLLVSRFTIGYKWTRSAQYPILGFSFGVGRKALFPSRRKK